MLVWLIDDLLLFIKHCHLLSLSHRLNLLVYVLHELSVKVTKLLFVILVFKPLGLYTKFVQMFGVPLKLFQTKDIDIM